MCQIKTAIMKTKNSLKSKRTQKGLTVKQISEKLNISTGQIKAIEEQKFIPNVSMAVKISRFFNLKVEDVFQVE